MNLDEQVKKLDAIGGSGEDIAAYNGKDLLKLEGVDLFKFCKANDSFKEPGISF